MRPSVSYDSDKDEIKITIQDKEYTYSHQDYDKVLTNLSNYANGKTYIYNKSEFEVLLDPLESRYLFRLQEHGISLSGNSVSYSIQAPSPELTLVYLSSIPIEEFRFFRRPLMFLDHNYRDDEIIDFNLFDYLNRILRTMFSAKIVSKETLALDIFKKHTTAFLFNISYNVGTVIKPVFDFFELSNNHSRSLRPHRLGLSDLDPPKLFYNSDLIEHYYLALSSNDSFIEFISYYHIMEYFFEEVYNTALVNNIIEILQHPSFSSKKHKDIVKIIDVVQKKTKVYKEEFQGTELEALELTIKAYISAGELLQAISDIDPSLVDYYKNHEVSFSKGDTFDLNDQLNERLPKKIAARIYKTRNSLVHSKSNNTRIKERGIYHPFSDEKELTNETPLMRIIAETIIIKTAEQI